MNKEWLNNIIKGYLFDLLEEIKRDEHPLLMLISGDIESPIITLKFLGQRDFFREIFNEDEFNRFKSNLKDIIENSSLKSEYDKIILSDNTFACGTDPVEEYPKEKGINYEELLYSDNYKDRIKVARAGLFLDKLVEDRNIRVVLEALDKEFEPARYARFILSPDKRLRNIGLLTYSNGLKGYSNKNILEEGL